MIRAVIFDLDGTLYDSTGLHRLVALKELSRLAFCRLLHERRARKELAGKDFGSKIAFEKTFFGKVSRDWYFGTYLPDMVSISGRGSTRAKGWKACLKKSGPQESRPPSSPTTVLCGKNSMLSA